MKRLALIPVAAALSLAACDQIRTPGSHDDTPLEEAEIAELPEAAPVEADDEIEIASVITKRAVIDWEQARADFAARDVGADDSIVEIASTERPSVPILLPSSPVSAASAGEEGGMSFRPLEDGYYAVYPGEAYDMIINGTDRLVAAPGRASVATDTELRFEETMTGAQIAFSRYGASYLVEFACKSPAAVRDSCVSEEDARAAVQDLLLAGTQ